MRTTKDIREAVAIYATLPRTNKFKRAVDLALAQGLPLEIKVASPFRAYRAKYTNGKTETFKVRLRNSNTGQVHFIGQCVTREIGDSKVGVYRGGHIFGAASFEAIKGMILEHYPSADLSAVEYNHVGAHSKDYVKTSISWASFAVGISKICKKDFAHTSPCGKCGGSGFLACFAHVDNGVCWDCCGSGQNLHLGEEAVKAA